MRFQNQDIFSTEPDLEKFKIIKLSQISEIIKLNTKNRFMFTVCYKIFATFILSQK